MPSTITMDAASLLTLMKTYVPAVSAQAVNGRLIVDMAEQNLTVDLGQFSGQANVTVQSLRIVIDDLTWRDGQVKATFQLAQAP